MPAVLGSFAALIVAFVSQMAQVSLPVFVARVFSAYIVFYAFGIVIHYVLVEGAAKSATPANKIEADGDAEVESIRPGTSVGELLGTDE